MVSYKKKEEGIRENWSKKGTRVREKSAQGEDALCSLNFPVRSLCSIRLNEKNPYIVPPSRHTLPKGLSFSFLFYQQHHLVAES